MSTSIALQSQKGGVQKTTICINLSVAFAKAGYSVFVIDADSQCNTYNLLTKRRNELNREESLQTVTTSFAEKLKERTQYRIDFVALEEQDITTVISEAKQKYDFVIIDSGCTLNNQTTFKIASQSDVCLFPFGLGQNDLDTAHYVDTLVKTVRKHYPKNTTAYHAILNVEPVIEADEQTKALEHLAQFKDSIPLLNTKFIKRKIYRKLEKTGKGVCELMTIQSAQAATEMQNLANTIANIKGGN